MNTSMPNVKITPSTRRIFNLNKINLLKHYALIVNKSSSLSSAQRKTVQYRVGYGLNKGTITPEEVKQSIEELVDFVQSHLLEAIKKQDFNEGRIQE